MIADVPEKLPIILGAVVPTGVVAGVLLAVRFGLRRQLAGRDVAIAIALGFLVGFRIITESWPAFPAADKEGWLFYIAAGGAVAALVLSMLPLRPWMTAILVTAGTAAVTHLVLKNVIQNQKWTTQDTVKTIGLLSAFAGLCYWSLENLSLKNSDVSVWVPLLLTLVAGSVMIGMNGTQKYAQLTGALCAGVGVSMLLTMLTVRDPLARGPLIVIVPLITALLAIAMFTAELETRHARMLAYAPLLLWVSRIRWLESMRPWKKTILGCVVVAIPLGFALGQIVPKFIKDLKERQSDPYSAYE